MNLKPLSADELVQAFVGRLRNRKADVRRIASFWNSFEHWLKFELALELCNTRWKRRPWSDQSERATVESIGVEYKVPLGRKATRRDLTMKQVDLWVCSRRRGEKWHYVELKVAFNNANHQKQLASWQSDQELLRQIRDTGTDGRLAVLVAVGFEKAILKSVAKETQATLDEFFPALGRGPEATPSIGVLSLR